MGTGTASLPSQSPFLPNALMCGVALSVHRDNVRTDAVRSPASPGHRSPPREQGRGLSLPGPSLALRATILRRAFGHRSPRREQGRGLELAGSLAGASGYDAAEKNQMKAYEIQEKFG